MEPTPNIYKRFVSRYKRFTLTSDETSGDSPKQKIEESVLKIPDKNKGCWRRSAYVSPESNDSVLSCSTFLTGTCCPARCLDICLTCFDTPGRKQITRTKLTNWSIPNKLFLISKYTKFKNEIVTSQNQDTTFEMPCIN